MSAELAQRPAAVSLQPSSGATAAPAPLAAVDFYSRQTVNRRRTEVIVAGFVVFFLVLGLGIDALWAGFFDPGGERFPVVTGIALVAAVARISAGHKW